VTCTSSSRITGFCFRLCSMGGAEQVTGDMGFAN
jgi:hypothetical protein